MNIERMLLSVVETEDISIIDKFIEREVKFEDLRSTHIACLLFACSNGSLVIAKWIESRKLGVNLIRTMDNVALRHACRKGHLEIVKWLLEQGLSLSDIRTFGNEALYNACANGHLEIAEVLIYYGLDESDFEVIRNPKTKAWAMEQVRYRHTIKSAK